MHTISVMLKLKHGQPVSIFYRKSQKKMIRFSHNVDTELHIKNKKKNSFFVQTELE